MNKPPPETLATASSPSICSTGSHSTVPLSSDEASLPQPMEPTRVSPQKGSGLSGLQEGVSTSSSSAATDKAPSQQVSSAPLTTPPLSFPATPSATASSPISTPRSKGMGSALRELPSRARGMKKTSTIASASPTTSSPAKPRSTGPMRPSIAPGTTSRRQTKSIVASTVSSSLLAKHPAESTSFSSSPCSLRGLLSTPSISSSDTTRKNRIPTATSTTSKKEGSGNSSRSGSGEGRSLMSSSNRQAQDRKDHGKTHPEGQPAAATPPTRTPKGSLCVSQSEVASSSRTTSRTLASPHSPFHVHDTASVDGRPSSRAPSTVGQAWRVLRSTTGRGKGETWRSESAGSKSGGRTEEASAGSTSSRCSSPRPCRVRTSDITGEHEKETTSTRRQLLVKVAEQVPTTTPSPPPSSFSSLGSSLSPGPTKRVLLRRAPARPTDDGTVATVHHHHSDLPRQASLVDPMKMITTTVSPNETEPASCSPTPPPTEEVIVEDGDSKYTPIMRTVDTHTEKEYGVGGVFPISESSSSSSPYLLPLGSPSMITAGGGMETDGSPQHLETVVGGEGEGSPASTTTTTTSLVMGTNARRLRSPGLTASSVGLRIDTTKDKNAHESETPLPQEGRTAESLSTSPTPPPPFTSILSRSSHTQPILTPFSSVSTSPTPTPTPPLTHPIPGGEGGEKKEQAGRSTVLTSLGGKCNSFRTARMVVLPSTPDEVEYKEREDSLPRSVFSPSLPHMGHGMSGGKGEEKTERRGRQGRNGLYGSPDGKRELSLPSTSHNSSSFSALPSSSPSSPPSSATNPFFSSFLSLSASSPFSRPSPAAPWSPVGGKHIDTRDDRQRNGERASAAANANSSPRRRSESRDGSVSRARNGRGRGWLPMAVSPPAFRVSVSKSRARHVPTVVVNSTVSRPSTSTERVPLHVGALSASAPVSGCPFGVAPSLPFSSSALTPAAPNLMMTMMENESVAGASTGKPVATPSPLPSSASISFTVPQTLGGRSHSSMSSSTELLCVPPGPSPHAGPSPTSRWLSGSGCRRTPLVRISLTTQFLDTSDPLDHLSVEGKSEGGSALAGRGVSSRCSNSTAGCTSSTFASTSRSATEEDSHTKDNSTSSQCIPLTSTIVKTEQEEEEKQKAGEQGKQIAEHRVANEGPRSTTLEQRLRTLRRGGLHIVIPSQMGRSEDHFDLPSPIPSPPSASTSSSETGEVDRQEVSAPVVRRQRQVMLEDGLEDEEGRSSSSTHSQKGQRKYSSASRDSSLFRSAAPPPQPSSFSTPTSFFVPFSPVGGGTINGNRSESARSAKENGTAKGGARHKGSVANRSMRESSQCLNANSQYRSESRRSSSTATPRTPCPMLFISHCTSCILLKPCSICRKELDNTSTMYRCEECNYLECSECHRLNEEEKEALRRKKTEEWKLEKKAMSSRRFSLSSSHASSLAQGSSSRTARTNSNNTSQTISTAEKDGFFYPIPFSSGKHLHEDRGNGDSTSPSSSSTNSSSLPSSSSFSDPAHRHVLKACKWNVPTVEIQDPVVANKTFNSEGNRIINDYEVVKELGKGSFATVKLVQHVETGELFALKILRKFRKRSFGSSRRSMMSFSETMESEEKRISDELLREIAVMRLVDHPNIVKLQEVIDDVEDEKIYIIMEYCAGGPIHVLGDPPVPVEKVRLYGSQLASALLYLHSEFLYHRDVKPANVLVDGKGVAKLVDFGTCNSRTRTNMAAGTPAYSCPELVRGEEVSGDVVDSWAFAITLFQMAYGALPYPSHLNTFSLRQLLLSDDPLVIPPYPEDPSLQVLLTRMLCKDRAQRLVLEEAAHHPFFFILPEESPEEGTGGEGDGNATHGKSDTEFHSSPMEDRRPPTTALGPACRRGSLGVVGPRSRRGSLVGITGPLPSAMEGSGETVNRRLGDGPSAGIKAAALSVVQKGRMLKAALHNVQSREIKRGRAGSKGSRSSSSSVNVPISTTNEHTRERSRSCGRATPSIKPLSILPLSRVGGGTPVSEGHAGEEEGERRPCSTPGEEVQRGRRRSRPSPTVKTETIRAPTPGGEDREGHETQGWREEGTEAASLGKTAVKELDSIAVVGTTEAEIGGTTVKTPTCSMQRRRDTEKRIPTSYLHPSRLPLFYARTDEEEGKGKKTNPTSTARGEPRSVGHTARRRESSTHSFLSGKLSEQEAWHRTPGKEEEESSGVFSSFPSSYTFISLPHPSAKPHPPPPGGHASAALPPSMPSLSAPSCSLSSMGLESLCCPYPLTVPPSPAKAPPAERASTSDRSSSCSSSCSSSMLSMSCGSPLPAPPPPPSSATSLVPPSHLTPSSPPSPSRLSLPPGVVTAASSCALGSPSTTITTSMGSSSEETSFSPATTLPSPTGHGGFRKGTSTHADTTTTPAPPSEPVEPHPPHYPEHTASPSHGSVYPPLLLHGEASQKGTPRSSVYPIMVQDTRFRCPSNGSMCRDTASGILSTTTTSRTDGGDGTKDSNEEGKRKEQGSPLAMAVLSRHSSHTGADDETPEENEGIRGSFSASSLFSTSVLSMRSQRSPSCTEHGWPSIRYLREQEGKEKNWWSGNQADPLVATPPLPQHPLSSISSPARSTSNPSSCTSMSSPFALSSSSQRERITVPLLHFPAKVTEEALPMNAIFSSSMSSPSSSSPSPSSASSSKYCFRRLAKEEGNPDKAPGAPSSPRTALLPSPYFRRRLRWEGGKEKGAGEGEPILSCSSPMLHALHASAYHGNIAPGRRTSTPATTSTSPSLHTSTAVSSLSAMGSSFRGTSTRPALATRTTRDDEKSSSSQSKSLSSLLSLRKAKGEEKKKIPPKEDTKVELRRSTR